MYGTKEWAGQHQHIWIRSQFGRETQQYSATEPLVLSQAVCGRKLGLRFSAAVGCACPAELLPLSAIGASTGPYGRDGRLGGVIVLLPDLGVGYCERTQKTVTKVL